MVAIHGRSQELGDGRSLNKSNIKALDVDLCAGALGTDSAGVLHNALISGASGTVR
jgi:hypothetical protein